MDKGIVEKVLVTLPERFESMISFLEEYKDLSKLSLGELMSALQAQEKRRTMRQEKLIEGVFSIQKQKGKQQFHQKNKGKHDGGTNSGDVNQKFPPCKIVKEIHIWRSTVGGESMLYVTTVSRRDTYSRSANQEQRPLVLCKHK